MPSENDLGTDNVATVTGWIQQAVANKMWVIILWHRVDEADPNTGAPNPISVPSPVIQGVVNYIVANGIHVVTDSEGLVIEGSGEEGEVTSSGAISSPPGPGT